MAPTRLQTLLAVALALLAACGAGSPAAGTWALDVEATRAANPDAFDAPADLAPEDAAEMRALLDGMFASMSMTLTLDEDGALTGSMKLGTREDALLGTWSLDGETVTIVGKTASGEDHGMTARLDHARLVIDAAGDGAGIEMILVRR